jgi:hypothetical protein
MIGRQPGQSDRFFFSFQRPGKCANCRIELDGFLSIYIFRCDSGYQEEVEKTSKVNQCQFVRQETQEGIRSARVFA